MGRAKITAALHADILFCGRLAYTALGLFISRFLNLDTSQIGINHNAAAIFANNDFLTHADIQLPLGRDFIETTATGITLYINNAQTVTRVIADTLKGRKQTRLNGQLKILSLLAGFFLLAPMVRVASPMRLF